MLPVSVLINKIQDIKKSRQVILQLVKHGEELKLARIVQRNIIATIEALSLCTPVLEQFCKLLEQMDGKQYYSALKTLEQLEHTHLPRISG